MPLNHNMGHAKKLFGAKSRGGIGQIILPNGSKLFSTFLGLGKFTNSFLSGKDTVYLYTQDEDQSKDVLTLAANFFGQSNPYLPRMTKLGSFGGNGNWGVYKTKMYHTNVGKADMLPSAWDMRLKLQEAHHYADTSTDRFDPDRPAKFNRAFIRAFCGYNSHAYPKMLDALIILNRASLMYGPHFMFDSFSRRNTAIDNKGHLILIDPMFNADIVRQRLRKK